MRHHEAQVVHEGRQVVDHADLERAAQPGGVHLVEDADSSLDAGEFGAVHPAHDDQCRVIASAAVQRADREPDRLAVLRYLNSSQPDSFMPAVGDMVSIP